MRALTIDDAAKAKVQAVLDYAKKKENWYSCDPNQYQTGKIPGENPYLTCYLDTYRCVFSYTVNQKRLYRHLSVSIPAEGFPGEPGYPNAVAVLAIAELFGFTGWDHKTITPPVGWMVGINDAHAPVKFVSCMQRVREADL